MDGGSPPCGTADGWQTAAKEILDREATPVKKVRNWDGDHLVIRVPYVEPAIYVAVWKVDVTPRARGVVTPAWETPRYE